MPGTEQMLNINPLPFSSSTAFCLVPQLFLLTSEPVKATQCCTSQFIALVQSGICLQGDSFCNFLARNGIRKQRLPIPLHHLGLSQCSHRPVVHRGVWWWTGQSLSILLNSSPEPIRSQRVWKHPSQPPLSWCNLKWEGRVDGGLSLPSRPDAAAQRTSCLYSSGYVDV